MPSTLTHRASVRRAPAGFRRLVPVVAFVLLTGSCTAWTGGAGSPAGIDRVDELRPGRAGTYRMVGTEQDGQTGERRRTVVTSTVEPAFTSAGVEHQVTSFDDGAGRTGRWETELRPAGAYRVRESAGTASWDWSPPLRTVSLPLRVGSTWRYSGTATVADVNGSRMVIKVTGRVTAPGTETVKVGDRRVFAFVLKGTVTTTVTRTDRLSAKVTTTVTESTGRSWFAPSRTLVVRTESVTTTREGDGPDRVVTSEATVDRL